MATEFGWISKKTLAALSSKGTAPKSNTRKIQKGKHWNVPENQTDEEKKTKKSFGSPCRSRVVDLYRRTWFSATLYAHSRNRNITCTLYRISKLLWHHNVTTQTCSFGYNSTLIVPHCALTSEAGSVCALLSELDSAVARKRPHDGEKSFDQLL